MIPMNTSESRLLTAYRSSWNHFHRLKPRKTAVMNPQIEISGTPRNLYRAIGEFS